MCDYRRAEGGIREVDEGIHRFIAPLDDNEDCGGGWSGGGYGGGSGSGSGSSTTTYNAKTSNIGLNQLIQNLRTVENGSENWFQNIFGTYKYAHEYFNNDDYRFELDYWDQTWFIYRSIGIEAETHKEGWFWWNNTKSDEIVLGINKVHLVYNLPAPNIGYAQNFVQNTLNSLTTQPLYIHNGRFSIKNNNSIYTPIEIKILNNAQIPFFEFRDEAILNIYIGRVLGVNINTDISYNVLNDSNIKQLYKLGAEFLKEQASSNIGKRFFVTVQKNLNEVDLLYFDEFQRVYNVAEVQKKFFSDWAWQVSVNSADGGANWSSDYGLSNFTGSGFTSLGDYKEKYIDIYGLARRGNEWKGLRLILK